MKLLVRVIEARNLTIVDANGLGAAYVKLQLGKCRAKTKVSKKNPNPSWDEEFSFGVGDLSEELSVRVLDEDKCFTEDFLGCVKVPLSKVMDAENMSLGTTWYQLQPKGRKSKGNGCGEILLAIFLYQNNYEEASSGRRSFSDDKESMSEKSVELTHEIHSLPSSGDSELASVSGLNEMDFTKEDKSMAESFIHRLFQFFGGEKIAPLSSTIDVDPPEKLQEVSADEQTVDVSSAMLYDELLKTLESKVQGAEIPENLQGGILVDHSYVIAPADLNSFLFSPSSNFWQSLAEIQGTTGLQAEPWRLESSGKRLTRVVKYTKAATKLVKAVTATEEQTYLKADGKNYAVLASVRTPDVPFGNSFRVQLLFCITPGPELSSKEQSSRLIISWCINFLQSTMMKGMIENGARQGLRESYVQFTDLLSQSIKLVDLKVTASDKKHILASLQTKQESDWKLALQFFGNFSVASSGFAILFILIHILLANPGAIHGLELLGLDLPDSIGEIIVCGVLVLQSEYVLYTVSRFLQARKQRGSDHGKKARGDGWLLTVALIEGSNLVALDSAGFSDPYVVFTCNGKMRTSSIKFHRLDPQWNEIFEFDAMDDPPSTMDVDVYDFDGPFDKATSLGHAEVNFVKSNITELADVWLPLHGKFAQKCQSKLHLMIFLNNTRGNEIVKGYVMKMEKEIGNKITLKPPQINSAFQKLFGLPADEFLINDFTCHLNRKMPMQGRLFLSPRIIGFHANLFGRKTKFFFLWEDIDDIQVIPPSLATMCSPSLLIVLQRGRGMDAKHGAKAVDSDGRLRFQFQSFVSLYAANRTIMALWKAKALSTEQKLQLVEESGMRSLQSEDSGSFLGLEEAKMSDVFSSSITVEMELLMGLFDGSSLEQSVMKKIGCVDYSVSPWESIKGDIYQRQVHYKMDKSLSRYGGEVTSTQQKSPVAHKKGWLIEEVMVFQGVLLGDYFNIHLRYHIEDLSPKLRGCNVQVSLGVAWLKSTKHQKRIMKNIMSNSSGRLQEMFNQVESELK
ncbi:C2 and GRAM domain-containing protein At1g03370-like [Curcuma longa]|uniref:C2 and GRAM domain-containing protein At1g03370-like n=1 Tax=Curcuma longa TaxID=136217 RepID=UPI003D9E2CDC